MGATAEIYERGLVPCRHCGKVHSLRPTKDAKNGYRTWADPNDGHPYYPHSWQSVAEALSGKSGIPISQAFE